MLNYVKIEKQLLSRWRRLVANRRRRNRHAEPRSFAAVGILTHMRPPQRFVEIERMLLVVLHDDDVGLRWAALRLSAFAGRRVSHGVVWGGEAGCPLYKDLSLKPQQGARGLRLDLRNPRLLELGLRLERRLQRATRRPSPHIRSVPRLPSLWAAFRPAEAATMTKEGPEFVVAQTKFHLVAQPLLDSFRRDELGLALFPLDWVSHRLEQAVAVFADLESFPRRQVFRMSDVPNGLIGYQGAAAFDFYHSVFRDRSCRQSGTGAVPAA